MLYWGSPMNRIYALATTTIVLLSCQVAMATNPFTGQQANAKVSVTWEEVANYLADHAVNYDPATEDALHFEAAVGMQTWTVVGSETAASIRPDGPAIGWPQVGMTIEFETEAEAVEAANLIIDVTYDIP